MNRRLARARALAALLSAAACLPALAMTPLDLGDPSVQSQRGQRLKLALPYGAAPGEPVSVTRFEVVSVEAPPGHVAPRPETFSIAKPPRRNLVWLQSAERVDAPELTLAVRVAGQPGEPQVWRIAVPPQSITLASPASATEAAAPAPRAGVRTGKRRPTGGR